MPINDILHQLDSLGGLKFLVIIVALVIGFMVILWVSKFARDGWTAFWKEMSKEKGFVQSWLKFFAVLVIAGLITSWVWQWPIDFTGFEATEVVPEGAQPSYESLEDWGDTLLADLKDQAARLTNSELNDPIGEMQLPISIEVRQADSMTGLPPVSYTVAIYLVGTVERTETITDTQTFLTEKAHRLVDEGTRIWTRDRQNLFVSAQTRADYDYRVYTLEYLWDTSGITKTKVLSDALNLGKYNGMKAMVDRSAETNIPRAIYPPTQIFYHSELEGYRAVWRQQEAVRDTLDTTVQLDFYERQAAEDELAKSQTQLVAQLRLLNEWGTQQGFVLRDLGNIETATTASLNGRKTTIISNTAKIELQQAEGAAASGSRISWGVILGIIGLVIFLGYLGFKRRSGHSSTSSSSGGSRPRRTRPTPPPVPHRPSRSTRSRTHFGGRPPLP